MEYIEIAKYIGTMIVTWLLGYLSKKSNWVNNNLIPLQNFFIGLIVGITNYIVTKDLSSSFVLFSSSLTAAGVYDMAHGRNKIKDGNAEWEENCEEHIGE